MVDPDAADLGIADALDEIASRRERGEQPRPEEYRQRLGESYPRFVRALTSSDLLGEVLKEVAEEPEPLPRLFGPYLLQREVGRGAAGVVYEAVHQLLKRRAAVKILHPEIQDDPTTVMRFQREIEALGSLNHPHIVPIYEAGVEAGRPFYAMAFIDGQPLSALVKSRQLPEPRALARQLAGVADALATLHQARPRLIHRDVKPANILVRADGTALLADFGHARMEEAAALTTSGRALGTPLYMSPEQLQGRREEMDGRTDVYGLGATLYEALAGRPPFPAEHMAALMRMVLLEAPVPPHRVNPDVPTGLEQVALKALSKLPADRYQSAGEMRDDLLRFAEDRPVLGRPVGRATLLLRGARRRRLPLTAAALALGVGAFAWMRRPASLALVSLPEQASVTIDGEPRGLTPLANLSLSPGRHVVRLSTEGFVDAEVLLELRAGSEQEKLVHMRIEDPPSLKSLARLLAAARVPYNGLTVASAQRGGEFGVAYPAGDVRLADLDSFDFDPDPPDRLMDLPAEGIPIEFRRGEELLGTTSIPLERMRDRRLPLPEKVRGQLRVGDQVTWGWWSSAHARGTEPKDRVQRFRVVQDRASADLEALSTVLEGQPATAVTVARSYLLFSKGLYTAAAREAEDLAQRQPKTPIAWALCGHAYAQMRVRAGRVADAWAAWMAFPEDVRAGLSGLAADAPKNAPQTPGR